MFSEENAYIENCRKMSVKQNDLTSVMQKDVRTISQIFGFICNVFFFKFLKVILSEVKTDLKFIVLNILFCASETF